MQGNLLLMRPLLPPFRIKVVQPIQCLTRQEREQVLEKAGWNMLNIKAEDVFIDLITDSGTSAMSAHQWAGMIIGDEAHAGSQSYFRLLEAALEVFGYSFTIPVHQGRGAEQLLFPELARKCVNRSSHRARGLDESQEPKLEKDQTRAEELAQRGQSVFISNYHFDTTREHVERAGARAIDVLTPFALDTTNAYEWKGNFDIAKLKETIKTFGGSNVAGIIATLTCNTIGGQPASMQNLEDVAEIATANGIPLVIDAARFAENAWFIKQREPDYSDKTIGEIVLRMFSFADAMIFSGRKDGLCNTGGLCCIKSDEILFQTLQTECILREGHATLGGMSGRDMEALAIGLHEAIDLNHLNYRIGQVQQLGEKLLDVGIAIQTPPGGHGIYIDAAKFLPHLPPDQHPAYALACELYLEGGVRGMENAGMMHCYNTKKRPPLELLRLAIPRRVYTQEHVDFVVECLVELKKRARQIRGLAVAEKPNVPGYFGTRLRPLC